MRQAAQRFLRDLSRSLRKNPPFVFSPRWANRACAFIEQLPHVEGEWDAENIVLQPAQIFLVAQLFGFRKLDGTRRFSEVLYATARKNAKSTLSAAIMLAAFCLEKENGAQAISAATTGDQAKIIWNIAKRMIEKTEPLRDAFDIETFSKSIARYETGGVFKPINSKASTQDGLNPSHTALDEIHAHKTHDLLNVLRSAAGGRKNPLWLYTTTEGYENPGPWRELREYAKRVLDRIVEADHFLVVLYMMDDDDDELDERCWPKANPLIYTNPLILSEMRKLAVNAQQMPSVLTEFRIKRCNLPSASASAWVKLRKWNRCGGDVDLSFLEGKPCWAAFDLAATSDMNAWRLLWKVDDIYFTWGRYWVPTEAVQQRTEGGRVRYDGWVSAGLVKQTTGDATDYNVIRADILADCARFSPQKIGYDSWNAASLVNDLVEESLPLELFIQGPKSYNPAMKECEIAYTTGKLRHAGDPVLRWNIANVVPRYDQNMNVAPDRKRSADKIDGACALFMAFGMALVADEGGDSDGFFSKPVRN